MPQEVAQAMEKVNQMKLDAEAASKLTTSWRQDDSRARARIALIIALVFAVLQSTVPLTGALRGRTSLAMGFAQSSAAICPMLCSYCFAFLCLVPGVCYQRLLALTYVALNLPNSALPWYYPTSVRCGAATRVPLLLWR